MIVLNNDIIFEQSDFLTELENLAHTWESDSVGVVGPDIVTLTQQHQNPFRQSAYKMADVKKAIRNKTIFLWYFYLKKFLHLENRIFILENMFEHKSGQRRSELAWDKKQDNVVLQGACLIFLPAFVKNEENAFCKDTFLYGEEDVLYYLCEKKGMVCVHAIPACQTSGRTGNEKEIFQIHSEKYFYLSKYTEQPWCIEKTDGI